MAATTPTPSISTINRFRPKKPLDIWSTREKLCLASAVFKIGDQNWVSVSRAIKPYVDPKRPAEWFHQKNCVSQYYDMLEQLEQPKRKRGDRSESDTPSLQIMRKMTIERSEQLKKEIMEMQQTYKQLRTEVEAIKAGQWDDRLQQEWDAINTEQKIKEEAEAIKVEVSDDTEQEDIKPSGTDAQVFTPLSTETFDAMQDSVGENVDISVLTDEEATQSSIPAATTLSLSSSSLGSSLGASSKLPVSMLSSLLISEVKSATGLQQLKDEQEHGHQVPNTVSVPSQRSLLKTPITQDDILTAPPSSSAPTLSRLLSTAKLPGQTTTTTTTSTISTISTLSSPSVQTDKLASKTPVEEMQRPKPEVPDFDKTEVTLKTERVLDEEAVPTVTTVKKEIVDKSEPRVDQLVKTEELPVEDIGAEEETNDFAIELDVEAVENLAKDNSGREDEDFEISFKPSSETLASEAELTDSMIKDEPLSPTSSISSRISETGSKRGSRGKGRPRASRISRSSLRKSNTDDERKDDGGSSRHSDGELSDDEVRESVDLLNDVPLSVTASSILSESFPNSPASLSMCSDTEEEKSFKQWKKSIMLVWRAAATHKYANVFLHPVTDDIAPGYKSVVLRPMDLSTIKKNVETGVIRTTVEFQRDMMLMFSNAIMYNSSDHNVYRMAQEMYDDVMQHIEQYVNTQIIMQSTDAKNLRQSRRPEGLEKEEDSKKRRLSVDHSEGGKSKKRKTRLDESQ